MITEDYVSIETAKLLKEKGFDEVCFKYALNGKIYNYGDFVICHKDDVEVGIPILQSAMKWLREIHNLHIMIDCIGFENYLPTIQFTHSCKDVKFESKINKLGGNGFDTYEEACEEAIKYCLENLI